jgi:rare lipoprotein A
MKSPARIALGAAVALQLASCGGGDRPHVGAGGRHWVAVDTPVKIGRPYQAGGRWWMPADAPDLDEVGYATWYGSDHQGAATASGERFERMRVSAAHRTLPLPSYVEVTALGSGRTILVRINDRGPFKPERIIDLSQAAARQIGIEGQGIAQVRVRRVEPPEWERALLRAGRQAGYRATLGASERERLVRRIGGMTPASSDSVVLQQWYIQIAAFSDRARAVGLVDSLREFGRGEALQAGEVWRVRIGPYADMAAASAMLARLRTRGYQDARISPPNPIDRPADRKTSS